jgi:hypothetical protein
MLGLPRSLEGVPAILPQLVKKYGSTEDDTAFIVRYVKEGFGLGERLMLDTKNRPRDSAQSEKPESSDSNPVSESASENRSGLVIVIGVVALTSMIFGFILGRLF